MPEDVLRAMDEWGPERVVCVSDRRTGMRGVLVLDNTSRGMGKGGTRMSPTVTVEEISRLARAMTWKWAIVDLFFGGAKAGIAGDPNAPDKERVVRSFARQLAEEVPREYVLGLDMGLSERDAAIMRDELDDRGAAVGLPAALGGLPYDQLGITGFGVAESAEAAASVSGLDLAGSRVVVQGFGAVGAAAARRLVELGAQVVAVSTSAGAVHAPDGLDVEKLLALRDEHGEACVERYPAGVQPLGAELEVETDVLVPAATQDVITADHARSTTARLVVEGANLPASAEARTILHERGVTVVPDVVANAGGVVAAAHSMDARYSPFRPDPEAVFADVATKLRANTATVLESARRSGSEPHAAAHALAQSRVAEAMRLRGHRAPEAAVLEGVSA